ncbi:hypothetical protein [Bradyrhizobium sp. McL0615]|uniref:hypothetical protein n=1 Tax=Bradyrhizobium sp. McL0615 TaxID=3415673 RepID=UPI003CF8D5ED
MWAFTRSAAIRSPIAIFFIFRAKVISIMPRPRVPLIKAQTTGRTLKNPKRFKNRTEPTGLGALGPPPKFLRTASQKEAWNTFAKELPWLNYSHRALVSIASDIRGRQIAGEDVGVKALNLLRMMLNSMGATPSDASKVKMPDEGDPEDPAAKYF